MGAADAAERSLKEGDPAAALQQLQEQVRARPADAKLRVFLFQLLSILGQWERALHQLKVAAELDPAALPMQETYRDAVRCEAIRADVFAGTRVPMIFGEPDQWLAILLEGLLLAGRGEPARSEELRARAFEEAPASPGTVNGQPFAWIADADSRLGPVIEAIVNGRYYWVPFSRISRIQMEAPEDLRDLVWMPAHFDLTNGGETLALIPTRYPGSERSADGLIAMARKTIWEEVAPDVHRGLGQRIFATDGDDVAILDVRDLTIDGGEPPPDRRQDG